MKKRHCGILFLFLILFSFSYGNTKRIKDEINFKITKILPEGYYYDNGGEILYRITLENISNKVIEGNLSVEGTDSTGNIENIFANNSFTINEKQTNKVKDIILNPGIERNFLVKGIVGENIDFPIVLQGNFTDTLGNNIQCKSLSLERVEYNVLGTLKVNKVDYIPGDKIEYTIILKNKGLETIKNVSIEDILNTKEIFDKVAIKGIKNGEGTSLGNYESEGNLKVKDAILGPLGKLVYTIEGRVKNTYRGPISNEFFYTIRGKKNVVVGETLNVPQYEYKLEVIPTVGTYSPGKFIEYSLVITNTSKTVTIRELEVDLGLDKVMTMDPMKKLIRAFPMEERSESIVEIPIIKPESSKEIRRFIEINKDAVGSIAIDAKVQEKNLNDKLAPRAVYISKQGKLKSELFIATGDKYYPMDVLGYRIVLTNEGDGILTEGTLVEKLKEINTTLANGGIGDSSADVMGNPLESWKISISTSGLNSSYLLKSGGEFENCNLEDKNIVIYPGQNIVYTIFAKTKKTAIGNIVLNLAVNGNSIPGKTIMPQEFSKEIFINKSSENTQYGPGDSIEYLIEVKNNSGKAFGNNISVRDILSKILGEDYLGNKSPAFKNWVLYVKIRDGNGSEPSEFSYGITTTKDLNLSPDVGPSGSISYKLVCTVNDNILGPIKDNISSGTGDTVIENGTPIKMYPPKLKVTKEVNNTEYIPGQSLTYTINVENYGKGIGSNIEIVDDLANIKGKNIFSQEDKAYSQWFIVGNTYKIQGGGANPISNSGIPKEGTKENLNVKGTLFPGDGIQYIITAKINPLMKGKIINSVHVNNKLVSDKGAVSKDSYITWNGKVSPGTYPTNTNQIVYTIIIKNDSKGGFATEIPIKDEISKIEGELLRDKTKAKVFKKWTVAVETSGIGSEVKGTFENNKDILGTMNIAPDGYIKLTITGTIDNSSGAHILYGSFINRVLVQGTKKDFTVNPKKPILRLSKTVDKKHYDPQHPTEITYEITVENIGDGYLNNGVLTDEIGSILDDKVGKSAFKDIEITIKSIENTGSGSYVYEPFNINGNLKGNLDIAPHSKVVFQIKGKTQENIGGLLINRAKVEGDGNFLTASATIDEKDIDNRAVYMDKYAEEPIMTPGENYVYYINVVNNSKEELKDIQLIDNLNILRGTLANNGKTLGDISDGNVFIPGTEKITSIGGNFTKTKSGDIDLQPWEKIKYKVEGIVNPKILPKNVTNIASIISKINGNIKEIANASVTNNIYGGGAIISEIVKVNGVQQGILGKYTPGDQIEYIYKITGGGRGYTNNYKINKNIETIQSTVLDGTTRKNIFGNKWSLEYSNSQIKDPGTIVNVPVNNNSNIVGEADIAPGDTLVYTVKGTIEKEISGNIEIGGSTLEPYKCNLNISKTVKDIAYSPGKTINYILKIKNNSKGNGVNIPILDDLSSIKVKGIKGDMVDAFDKITKFETKVSTEEVINQIDGNWSTNRTIQGKVSIPVGGEVEYLLQAQVNDQAVGQITNIFQVGSDRTSAGISSERDRLEILYEVVAYETASHAPMKIFKYSPGGYVDYKIIFTNKGQGSIDDCIFKDEILDTKGLSWSGELINAFDSVEITISDGKNEKKISGNIDEILDMKPGEVITYDIKAKINKNLVGAFNNHFLVNGVRKDFENSVMAPSKTMVKKSIEENITSYVPGQKITYDIELNNVGLGTDYGKTFQDLLKYINTEISGPSEYQGNPFETWSVELPKISSDKISNLNGLVIGPNENIDTSKVIVGPKENIVFKVLGTISGKAIGDISNSAIYDGKTSTVNLKANSGELVMTNKLVKLNGQDYTGQEYAPGDEVEYLVTLENTGKGFLKNLSINDNLKNILGKKAGNEEKSSILKNIEITYSNFSKNSTIAGEINNGLISQRADIAPGDKIIYKIKGQISPDAIGIIGSNLLRVNNKSISSQTIKPKSSKLVGFKSILSKTSPENYYVPGEKITYEIEIDNLGEGYGDNVAVKDLLQKIQAEIVGGKVGNTFSSWEIKRTAMTSGNKGSQTFMKENFESSLGLEDEGDIAPGSTIKYEISAQVAGDVIGEVQNIGRLNGEPLLSKKLVLKPGLSSHISLKKNIIGNITTYGPGQDLDYLITIKNTSDTTFANLKLEDFLSRIETLSAGGNQKNALQGSWVIDKRITAGIPENSYINGIGNNGDINGRIDLGKNSVLEILIKAKVSPLAMGTITNEAKLYYNNSLIKTASISLDTEKGTGVGEVIGDKNYLPGQDYIYTISFKNTGKGFIKSGTIVDNLNLLKVKVVDDNLGMNTTEENAFDSESIKILEAKSTGQNSYLYPYNNGKSSQEADIAPGETITLKILGKINSKAVGEIINKIDFTGENGTIPNSVEKITNSIGYKLTSRKTVIGYENGNDYSDNGQLIYKIDIKNNDKGWAYNIPFKDDISKDLIVEKIELDGIIYKNGFQLSNNILGNIAINPLGTGTIKIYCKVNPHVTGEITNIALVDNKETNKVISKPISTNFTLDFKSEKPIYTYDLNGDIGEVIYEMKVTNIGKGIGYIELYDDLKNIEANSSKEGKMTAFKSWEFLEITKPSGINEVKNPNNNLEMKGYLEPKETISLKIKCKLNRNENGVPVSEIDNTLVLDYIKNGVDNFIKRTVTVDSPNPKLEVTKTIKTLGKFSYNNSSKYIPGEDIVYEISVKNTGEGFALGKDTVLEDNLALISGDILGGGKDALIEGEGITVTNINPTFSEFIKSNNTDSNNYSGKILLAPKDSMTFEIKGKINPLAIGTIPGNIVTVGKKNSTSESIEPQEGTITSTCTVDKETFYPGDNLTYKINLENIGEGYVKNLSLQDILGDIKTERVGVDQKAFKNWIINVKNLSNGKYYLRNSYPNENMNLSDSLDIAPGEKLEIEIIATVAPGVYGEITNNISIGGKTTSLKSKALLGRLSLAQKSLLPEYVPGGEVIYQITIENDTDGVVPFVNIKDEIGNIKSTGNGHKEEDALESWTMESIIGGKNSNETEIKISQGGNINIVNGFIGPKTTIKIKINGKVSEGIHGNITNTVDIKDGTGNIPLKVSATVAPAHGKINSTLTVQDKVYTPGVPIEYTLKVTNDGIGYCNDVDIKDDLSKIDELNLKSFKLIEKKVGQNSDIHEEKSNLQQGILNYLGDIAPGESIEIIFTVETTMEAKNSIENIGEITYLNKIENPKVTVESVPGDFIIGLSSMEKNYIPSHTVTYLITMENRGKGWLKGVSVLENINEIKTEVLGNTQGRILDNPICSHVGIEQTNIKVKNVPTGLKLFGDIPPMTKVEYKLQVVVSSDALGPIRNKLIGHESDKEYYSAEVTVEQEIPKLDLNLVEDKKNYYPNEDITYTLTVTNNTDLNINKVTLKDDIGSATVLTGDGTMEPAFKPGWVIKTMDGKILNTENNNCDMEFQMKSHSQKIFKISGKIIYNAVGKLLNGARVITDVENISKAVEANPLPPDLTIKKIALEKNYTPNKNIHYKIEVKNGLKGGYGDNIKIEDILSEIKATSTSGSENPFQLDRVKIKVLQKDIQVKTSWSENSNQYDLRDTVDIPRGQGLTYEIEAFVKNNIIGKIENIARGNKETSQVDLYSVAPKLKLEVNQKENNYIPGENINYTIRITNIGEGVAYNDEIFNNLEEIIEKNISGKEEKVLDNWTIEGPKGLHLDKENLKETLTLLPGQSADFKIEALVNKNVVENIEIPIYLNKDKKDAQLKKIKFTSPEGNLKLTKISDKKAYVDTDNEIIYTITAENDGLGNLRDVTIKDLIRDLKGKNGNPLFKSWTIEEEEIGDRANLKINILNNENLNIKCNLRAQGKNKLIFKIKGKINKGLDDDITNRVFGFYNSKEVVAQVTTHVKKIPDNTGNLTLIKRTNNPTIKIGEIASYEIIVDNNNESRFLNTKLLDIAPRAFNYINGSGKIIYYYPQEKDKKLREESIDPKIVDGNLNFEHIYLEPFQRIKITYSLKASIGVSLGIYENKAYMVLGNRKISNEGRAYVKIIPDSLLNKGTIIGKVYEDLNENGYQDDPTIKHLNILVDGKTIKLGKLYGISKYRKYGDNEKSYRFYKDDSNYSQIEINCEDMEKMKKLKVTKNIYWDSDKKSYLHEIIIENEGYYEDGIPGVKVLSPRGEIAVTDEYGRYHLPQQWIYNSKGENYSVKLDIESLPFNMKVLGENPKVKRITPQGLVKFNFPIIDMGGK